MCNFALGNYEKARDDFSVCIKLEEDAAEPIGRLKRANAMVVASSKDGLSATSTYNTKDNDQRKGLNRFMQIATTHALFNRALCFLRLKRSNLALRDFDRALKVDSGTFYTP